MCAEWVPTGMSRHAAKLCPIRVDQSVPMMCEVVGSASRKKCPVAMIHSNYFRYAQIWAQGLPHISSWQKKWCKIPWRQQLKNIFYKWSDAAVCDNESVTPLVQLKYVISLLIHCGRYSQPVAKLQQDHKCSSYTTYFLGEMMLLFDKVFFAGEGPPRFFSLDFLCPPRSLIVVTLHCSPNFHNFQSVSVQFQV